MRAYGSEPILYSTSPVTPLQNDSRQPKKRRLQRLGATVLLGIIVMIIGVGLWFLHQNNSPQIPERFLSLPFQLYEPGKLPDGMSIDGSSFSATSQALTYSIRGAAGQQLVVTEQPRPSLKEIEEFYTGQLSESSKFTTLAGQGTIGDFEGSGLVGILTDETWILISSVSAMDTNQLKQIAVDFRSVP